MFQLISTKKEKAAAQRMLEDCIKRAWGQRETRRIVWRPSSRDMKINHNGRYWFGALHPDKADTTPRYWVPLGRYLTNKNLIISVELNVPTESNTKQVSAFFARDLATGSTCLFHDGGLGGGQPGVGRDAYLAWSKSKLLPVTYPGGETRLGILVTALDGPEAADNIGRFVQRAIDFKAAVKNGETRTKGARQAQQSYRDYFKEFSGKKKTSRRASLEYISRHGDVVEMLHTWRKRSQQPTQRLVKNAHIDLGVLAGESLVELYEVKTSLDRQTLYAGIGQLLVHDKGVDDCKRHLVLPEGIISDDLSNAINRHNIALLRFRIEGDRIKLCENA